VSSQIVVLLSKGLETINQVAPMFVSDPPQIVQGIERLAGLVWDIVIEMLPEDKKAEGARVRADWDKAFEDLVERIPAIKENIMKFKETTDVEALGMAIDDIFEFAATTASDVIPDAGIYIDAIGEIVEQIMNSWKAFKNGAPEQGAQAIWNGVILAVDLIPGAKENEIYQEVIGAIDPIIADLNNIVDSYKRKIQNSQMCYKRQVVPESSNPSECPSGDYMLTGKRCQPGVNAGADCWKPCGERGGFCEEFCGAGKACCKNGEDNPCECKGAIGFTVAQGQHGSAYDYHQCVAPGSWRALSNSSMADLDSVAARKAGATKPQPRAAPQCGPVSQPRSLAERGNASSFENALMKKNDKKVFGSVDAQCSADFPRKYKSTCYKECPSGYEASGSVCKQQDCGGEFSISAGMAPTMCAKQPGLLEAWIMETAMGGMTQALNIWQTIEGIVNESKEKEDGKPPFAKEALTNTLNSFVKWGEQFAHGVCPVLQ
jgi:hypothetical protein